MSDTSKTTNPHRLEAEVQMDDGSVVRITGLLAHRFPNDPDGVRKFIEEERTRKRDRENAHAN